MSSDLQKKQRAIVYIDGYNLYYRLQEAFRGKYKWLDLQGLGTSLLRPNTELVSVKYFTAITASTVKVEQRQRIYLRALKVYCDKLEIFYGHFQSNPKRCRHCGMEYRVFEEKKTDVNIACEILNDAHLDRYNCCYVVSGDSDLVPPLQIVKENYSGKRSIIAHPPRRKSAELCQTANGWFAISEQKFRKNQLPEKVVTHNGGTLTRPKDWK